MKIRTNINKEKSKVNNRDNSIKYSELLRTEKKESEEIKIKIRKLNKLLLIFSSKDDFENKNKKIKNKRLILDK